MKRIIKAGLADQTLDIFVPDSSSSVGAGLTGLAYNTASLVCYYRKGATGTPTALTLATQTVGGAHSDGGFVAVDGTNMPGVYRLDLSDTIIATAGAVTIMLKGAANMAPVVIELQVVAIDLADTVRMGLTALPNAAAEAAGGLYTRGTGAGQINQDANGRIDANVEAVDNGAPDTSATVAAAVVSALGTGSGLTSLGSAANLAAVKAKTDNLPSDPADASDIATLFAAVPAAVWDVSNGVESGVTFRSAMKALLAMLAGQRTGMATGTGVFKNPGGTKSRVTVTSDTDGNFSAITFDFS